MGLAESTNIATTESVMAKDKRVSHLVRSPSAPAGVSSAVPSDPSYFRSQKCHQKRVSEPLRTDTTSRINVSTDGAWAFYKANSFSQGRNKNTGQHQQIDFHDAHHSQTEKEESTPVRHSDLNVNISNNVVLEELINPTLDPALFNESLQEEESSVQNMDPQELKANIDIYNSISPAGLGITMEKNGTSFQGFIRVHMNLFKPITVIAEGNWTKSIYDIISDDDEDYRKTLTSFYLPRDTVKTLHITSETTTQEVISALLKKFRVVDNPKNFALYERFYEKNETIKAKMRRIADDARPLMLALHWAGNMDCNKAFVLQENDTGDILWEAFTLPELCNFLQILDKEEEEYKRLIQQKYEVLGLKIQEAMKKIHRKT